MGKNKCCDCDKILEPDEQLRFFENNEASGQEEGYLCEACADRRREEWDPQPNETTRKAMEELEAGGGRRFESVDALMDSLLNDPEGIEQIQLPDPADTDPHPRLMLGGEGIHAGQMLTVLTPEGWKEIRLESNWDKTGAACWYIATEGLRHICPVGLFVRLRLHAEDPDPFYSEKNMKWLLESMQAAEAGKLTKHELIEVEDNE